MARSPLFARGKRTVHGPAGAAALLLSLLVLWAPASAQGEPVPDPEASWEEEEAWDAGIEWVTGPGTGHLGSIATVEVPEGFIFAGPEDTRTLMEMMENPTNGTEKGFLAPESMEWYVVFDFDEIGYVKDDESGSLDSDEILESLREGNSQGNEVRKQRGWDTIEITGWMEAPHYDTRTNNLEWAVRLRSSAGGENVNYNSRLLGRRGVMSATLVGDEAGVRQNMASFREILAAHEYASGERYSEFKTGDKVAAYGLTALITGGAVAAALKTGLLQKFWKLIVVAVGGAAAGLRAMFRRSSRNTQGGSPTA